MSDKEEKKLSETSEGGHSNHDAAYYYGRGPAYYYVSGGGATYGAAAYGGDAYGNGTYGAAYYGGGGEGGGNSNNDDSMLGTLSIQRILRVMMQKWPTLLVSILLGLACGFAYYKTAPVVYRATATVEMMVRPKQAYRATAVYNETEGSADEILNTRLVKLRSRAVIDMVAERVRADFPNLGLSDEEMYMLLFSSVTMSPRRNTRLIDISATHTKPEVAQAIANAYSLTAEKFALEQNRSAADEAVSYLKATREARRRSIEEADQAALDFRVANKIDVMESQKRTIESILMQMNSSLATMESGETKGIEILSILDEAAKDPEKASSLPESVPRSEEIADAQKHLQNVMAERDALLRRYTAKHPDVIEKDAVLAVAQRQYSDAVGRARETAEANLKLLRQQIAALRLKKEQNEAESSALEVQIVSARMQFEQLQRDCGVNETIYNSLLRREEEAQLAIDQSATTTTVVNQAILPTTPISPKASVAFSAGPIAGFILGFLFILIIDRFEDRITGTSDIEEHMNTKVLALIPHVPHAKREILAQMSVARRFSRVAEAFAGLRSLLDSPRYRNLTKSVLVVSTQPAEGKTITSCNIAAASALAGRKTLLIDFDMRRPRLARIFGLRENHPASLLHTLYDGDKSKFPSLPIPSGTANLDIVTSRSSSKISPSDLLGSSIVVDFVKWACDNYDRVVIDSPPFGLVSDSIVLGTLVGSVILICRPDRSRFLAIRHALRRFTEAGSRVLGVVVNDVDFGRGAYVSNYDYASYGYSYGYRYGRYGKYGRYYSSASEHIDTSDSGSVRIHDSSTASNTHAANDSEPQTPATPAPSQNQSVLDVDDEV